MARSSNMVIPEVTMAEGIRALQERLEMLSIGTNGAINISYDAGYLDSMGGDYKKPIQFARPSSAVQHQDEADPTTAATPVAITQASGLTPIQSKFAYYKWTRDEVTRGKMTAADYSVALGQFLADDKLVSARDALLGAGVAAIDSMDTPSANYHVIDDTPGKVTGAKVKFTTSRLNTLLGKMGDARDDIVAIVMHSAVFSDLVGDQISNYKFDKVGGFSISTGNALAMGRSIIVCDSTALYSTFTSDYYTDYSVLGLGVGALNATIVKEDDVNIEYYDNVNVPYWTARQNYETNYSISGMKWESATPVINPTDAELATAANWDEFLGDHRECKIVKGVYNAT